MLKRNLKPLVVGVCVALMGLPTGAWSASTGNAAVEGARVKGLTEVRAMQQAELRQMQARVLESRRLLADARATRVERRAVADRDDTDEAREESREALDEARRQLREAARRVAELQRLGDDVGDALGGHAFSFAFSTDDDERPRLGLVMGKNEDSGVQILSVTPESPADEAGLRGGDVITSVNGKRLDDRNDDKRLNDFYSAVSDLSTDKAVTLSYRRDGGKENSVTVTPAQLDHFGFIPFVPNVDVTAVLEGVSDAMPFVNVFGDGGPLMGKMFIQQRMWRDFELTELDADLGKYFGTETGLLILDVPDSMNAQLHRGDVLKRIGEREPHDINHAFRILQSYEPGESITLYVLRDGKEQDVSVTVPEMSEHETFFERRIQAPRPPAPPAPANPADRKAPVSTVHHRIMLAPPVAPVAPAAPVVGHVI